MHAAGWDRDPSPRLDFSHIIYEKILRIDSAVI